MRAVWSRAGQLQGCRPRACLGVSNGWATRPSVASPGRRKVRASEVFTACYTAIMATAAVFDAGQKDRRRQELDRQIDEAQNALADLMDQATARDFASIVRSSAPAASTPYRWSEDMDEVLDSLCQPTLEKLVMDSRIRHTRDKHVAKLRASFHLKQFPEILVDEVKSSNRIHLTIRVEEENPNNPEREPVTGTQLAKVHAMIEDLVYELLQQAYETTKREFPQVFLPPPSSIDSASSAIRLLKSDGYPRYDHPSLLEVDALTGRRKLNEVIREILRQWDHQSRRQQYTAKICYNLLVCPVPPDIHTYNILIAGFTHLGEHSLAEVVVESFLYRSHLRATRATFLSVLDHYRLKGDMIGFYTLIRRLNGHDRRGVGLRRRVLSEVQHNVRLLEWVRTADVNVRKGYVNLRAPLGQMEFRAILQGLLDFGKLTDAAKVFVVFLQKDWDIHVDYLHRLVSAITSIIDHAAANILLDGLLNNMAVTTVNVLLKQGLNSTVRRRLRFLIHMCSGGNAGIPGLFQGRSPENVKRFVTLLFARDSLSSAAKLISQVSQAMRNGRLYRSGLEFRLDCALKHIEGAVQTQRNGMMEMERYRNLVALDHLQQQVWQSACDTKALKLQFRYIVATSSWPLLRGDALFKDRYTLDTQATVHI